MLYLFYKMRGGVDMRLSEKCRLVFCVLHIPTMKKGMRLGFNAHAPQNTSDRIHDIMAVL